PSRVAPLRARALPAQSSPRGRFRRGRSPLRVFSALDDGPGDLRALDLIAILDESLHLVHELGDVLELAVDRREPDIRHLVELLQVLHDELTELETADLLLRAIVKPGLDIGHHVIDRLDTDGALLTRLQDRAAELLAVERLTAPVALDHTRQHV